MQDDTTRHEWPQHEEIPGTEEDEASADWAWERFIRQNQAQARRVRKAQRPRRRSFWRGAPS